MTGEKLGHERFACRKRKMITIEIDGYLLQKKLEKALQEIVGDAAWKGSELRVPNTRRRWDMGYELNGKFTVVEFDGDAHYRDPLKIKIDDEKDTVAKELGYAAVRIPYWVQLTNVTLDYYFGLEADIFQDFPHGFITTKLFPASYCEMGIERFEEEVKNLPAGVSKDVISSLREKAEQHGKQYVLPSKLLHLLENVT